jgi:hypothetical protein
MKRRAACIFVVAISAGLTAIATIGGTFAARAVSVAPACQSVRVSGGDYNGGGGTIYAQVVVANIGSGPCRVVGRPWLRLPALAHSVTVDDITAGPNAGTPGGLVTLAPEQRARAVILIDPGSCGRGRTVTFGLLARAGWRTRSVTINGSICDDGSGRVAVGSFGR